MTLTLELPPDVQAALNEAARRQGRTPEQAALETLRHAYVAEPTTPPASANPASIDPTLALFAQWAAEDATDDPEELARRNREGDEFMEQLRQNRFNLEGRTDWRGLLDDGSEDNSDEAAA